MLPSREIARLIEIMAALRTPGTGCPWDLAQNFSSILPYTIEEAFEVADAIERDDKADLRDELGDLLLQVVFHSRLAEEQGSFDFGGVVEAITGKLIRRHPHVFGPKRDLSPDEVATLWDAIKATEKAERLAQHGDASASSLLANVPRTFPPTIRAHKLQTTAAAVGFDWTDTADVFAKVREELAEVSDALASHDGAATKDEIGDLIFAVINLSRHLGVDPDAALRNTNQKFERRFAFVESELARRGTSLAEAGLEAMEALWAEAKREERESR